MIIRLHNALFSQIQHSTHSWLPGLSARVVFAAVLLVYYLHSAQTKVGEGLAGFFQVQDGAYVQMLPQVMEQVGYDSSQIALFPFKMIVYAGTYAEFILPILLILGLFTRIAALGMIVFVLVQSVVDIIGHHAGTDTIGTWFDRLPNSVILDQRALWIFLLLYLVIYGAGRVSMDHALSRSNH